MSKLICLLFVAGAIAACAADQPEGDHMVKGFEDRFDGGVHLLMSNRLPVIVSVQVNAELKNAKADLPLLAMFTLKPHAAIRVVTIDQEDPQRGWKMNWRYSFNLGDHKAKHDSNMVYHVPFRGRFRLT